MKAIKAKESLLRNMMEKKKCVVVYGLREDVQAIRYKREKHEEKVEEKIIREMEKKDKSVVEETEDVAQSRKYVEGMKKPLKIRSKLQTAAKEALKNTWKLSRKE